MSTVYLNGEWVPAEQARVSIFDRGFLLGDGVFETGRLHRGSYFRLEQHLARLAGSAEILRLSPPAIEDLLAIANGLAERNPLQEASLRITLTRGAGGKGLGRRGAGPPTIVGTLSPIAEGWQARAEKGWTVRVSSVHRPAVDSVPAQIKALGRVYALLAYFEAEDAGFDDAVLLSAEGFVAEGPTWNLFWRVGRTIFTPSLDAGILAGVTRSIIIDLAVAAGYRVEEGRWSADVLAKVDEAFATMTSNGIVPLTRIDDRVLPPAEAAPRLQVEYWSLVRRELGQTE